MAETVNVHFLFSSPLIHLSMFDPISLKCAQSGTMFVQEPSTGNIPPGICTIRDVLVPLTPLVMFH